MNSKDVIEYIIKNKGKCRNFSMCTYCPIRSISTNCAYTRIKYNKAIEYYLTTYGKESLVELFI